MKVNNIYERLLNYADNMKIIDTHEHLPPHGTHQGETPDVLCDYLSHYISSDLQAAGMKGEELEKIRNYKFDLIERFKILEPYWNAVKNTSYYRSLEIAAKKIHNVYNITIDTIEELNEKFKKAAANENYGRYIMKDVCNIERSINDCWSDDMNWATTDMFAPAWHADSFPITAPTLDEHCELYKQNFLQKKADGMKTLKNGMAYGRTLYFEDVDFETANEEYKNKNFNSKKIQDYLFHYALKLAEEENFIIQIHTGIQEGMRNNLENSNPMLLKNLFTKYPNLTFDIFHMGYPYERELIVLAKTHANVYIDLCWTHIISPFAARNAFYEMLDVLPYTKIFGFGGDYCFYDGVVGHLTLAKQDICAVLAKKVKNGECDIELAEKILQAVLYDNAKRIFKL